MKTALFLLLDEYADWEIAFLSPYLNQSTKWQVKTVSLQDSVTSIGGIHTAIDYNLNTLRPQGDLLILIGGNTWNNDSPTLLEYIHNFFDTSKPIGAICGAVDYLAQNGFLNHFKHTGNSVELWSSFRNYHNKESFIKTQATRDRNLVTANGTATIDFSEYVLKMIELDTNENIEEQSFMNKYGFYEYCKKFGNPYE
ncbi:DJ-1/PfpI family protein [Staphylococcus caprae]|uniref:DJ-1/PfpI family protein n=1 Tax=Staphylococcus caprae TaxID=29380 RepID=UPI001F5A3719|nr:DJ-1/PfpI family protein [Staphylococcus caprae]MCI2954818.1 DJ-1/PfpI family protein [Staphylococcus caprae]